ncbi:MAG: homocysteine S-methyltransferase family protein [Pseudomonadota bacterium]
MGQDLAERSRCGEHPGASVRAVLEEPDVLEEIHKDYLSVGVDVITLNTYAATRWRMNRAGLADAHGEANRNALSSAVRARDAVNPGALVAACLPPLRSPFRADLVPETAILEAEYAEHALVVADGVDLFVCETMSLGREARAAATVAKSTGKPVFVSFTLRDVGPPRLRSGESLAQAVRLLDGIGVDGVMVNCSAPEPYGAAVVELEALMTPKPVGAYANGFRMIPRDWDLRNGFDALEVREDLTPDAYADHAKTWLDAGATIIGGCCHVGVAHMARLKEMRETLS